MTGERKTRRNDSQSKAHLDGGLYEISFMENHIEIYDLLKDQRSRCDSMKAIMRAEFFKGDPDLKARVLNLAFEFCYKIAL